MKGSILTAFIKDNFARQLLNAIFVLLLGGLFFYAFVLKGPFRSYLLPLGDETLIYIFLAIYLFASFCSEVPKFFKFKEEMAHRSHGVETDCVESFRGKDVEARAGELRRLREEGSEKLDYMVNLHKGLLASRVFFSSKKFLAATGSLYLAIIVSLAYVFGGSREMIKHPETRGFEVGPFEVPFPFFKIFGLDRIEDNHVYFIYAGFALAAALITVYSLWFFNSLKVERSKVRLDEKFNPVQSMRP